MARDPIQPQGNIYQYASEGIFKQNQLIANFNVRAGAKTDFVRLLFFELFQLRVDPARTGESDRHDDGVAQLTAWPRRPSGTRRAGLAESRAVSLAICSTGYSYYGPLTMRACMRAATSRFPTSHSLGSAFGVRAPLKVAMLLDGCYELMSLCPLHDIRAVFLESNDCAARVADPPRMGRQSRTHTALRRLAEAPLEDRYFDGEHNPASPEQDSST